MENTLKLMIQQVLLTRRNVRLTQIITSRSYCVNILDETKSRRKAELYTFIDSLRVRVKGGQGGDGLPSKGGLGGKGGDVVFIGTPKENYTLKRVLQYNPKKRYVAKNGDKSKLFTLFGAPGASIKIPVPTGVTVITEDGQRLGEINEPGDEVIAARGGEGGSQYNGFSGQKGQEHMVVLDLKLIADVGFVGFPNAGKSTLLKALSRATPRIAAYPFTTIRPNIGVIEYPDERRISLADLPGLIEGAHANIGMGHKFLKHVERTKLLLFVVDLHGFQLSPRHPKRSALDTIVLLNKELELYREDLITKPAVLALNKIDKLGSYPIVEEVRDTLFDDKKYQEYLQTLPENFRPEHLVRFDEIVPISAAKDPPSVRVLRDSIRKQIDINYELQKLEKSSDNYLQISS